MDVQIALAASPLHEMHLPQSSDLRSLKTHVSNIPELRKGMLKYEIEYDHVGDGKPHHSAQIDFVSDMGTGYIAFVRGENDWQYRGETNINGEVINYEGSSGHTSIHSIIRKVRGLAIKLI